MALLHCKAKVIWLLSICIGSQGDTEKIGIFHFRGYLYGQWVNKVVIKSSLPGFVAWQMGESYLLKLQVIDIDRPGKLEGVLLELRHLGKNFADHWEEY